MFFSRLRFILNSFWSSSFKASLSIGDRLKGLRRFVFGYCRAFSPDRVRLDAQLTPSHTLKCRIVSMIFPFDSVPMLYIVSCFPLSGFLRWLSELIQLESFPKCSTSNTVYSGIPSRSVFAELAVDLSTVGILEGITEGKHRKHISLEIFLIQFHFLKMSRSWK